MKNISTFIFYTISILLLISCNNEPAKNYIQYVDPLIGTGPATTISAKERAGDHVGNGQTVPAVTAPFGMTQWTPQIQNSEKKCMAPFYHRGTILQGFRASHWLSGSCTQDYGSFTVFATNREKSFKFIPNQRLSLYLLNTDNLSPAYMSVMFPELGIMTELTGTLRSGFFKFSWLDPKAPTILIDVNSDENQGFIKIDLEKQEVYGYNPVHRIYSGNEEPAGMSGYFVAKFDKKIVEYGTYGDLDYEVGSTERQNQKQVGAFITFDFTASESLKMKMGTSFTSIENARKNLESEISDWDFEKTKQNLEKTWNETLGRIDVESEDKKELTKFYTAMYHALFHPRLYSDVNGDYPGFAENYTIHNTKEFDYYGDFSNWDIYRAQMPLLSIIAPKEYNDMVKSLVAKAEQGGWLPIFPMWNSYTSAMIGDHSASIIADAYLKGFEFDIEKAYKYMRKNAFETPDPESYLDGKGRRALESYNQFGYIPLEDEVLDAFHQQEQVSRTLEYAYDDWCIAQVADKLGKKEDFDILAARALNYSNVFDDSKGWMNGRFADETFTDIFDANQEQSYITEGTPKHYTWYVPHDVEGLKSLMGGDEVFKEKLDQMIDKNEYWHGNEPSHQIPYFFNYVGEWDKTQKTVKHILETEYDIGPGGISGNDDAGQMSAWYIFGSIGFYPTCPGSNEYQLSSPVFNKVTLNLDKKYYPGGKFVLNAESESSKTIFSKVKLNAKEISTSIKHEDLQKGGNLEFLK